MRDICTETIVPIVPKFYHKVLKWLCAAGIGFSVLLLAFVGFLVGLIPLIVFWFLFQKSKGFTDGEYEYIHTNDVFDVDLVTGNEKRKNILSVNLRHVLLIAPKDSQELEDYRRFSEKDLTGNLLEAAPYAMVCTVGGKQQKLLLSLDTKMLNSLKLWLPGKVIIQA